MRYFCEKILDVPTSDMQTPRYPESFTCVYGPAVPVGAAVGAYVPAVGASVLAPAPPGRTVGFVGLAVALAVGLAVARFTVGLAVARFTVGLAVAGTVAL
eukprot:9592-Heterococcus_DN1.PRE.3